MASSSPSSIQKSFKYHVFLSFRGEDTRKTFVDHLYDRLKRVGIYTFRDNEELEKGKRIDELFKAIEKSRFFIIIFSKEYASSSWCLKEVTKIMECQDEIDQIAYPVFYDVEPSDIRKQDGPVGIAIAKHKNNEQIKEWEKALESAGNLVGWDLKKIANGHEAEAINIIIKEISVKLRSIHLREDDKIIGMESRMQGLESSLGIGLNDKARMIGIKGMGGIGKTTLARAIFDNVSSQFEGRCFVENVRERSNTPGGLLLLQRQVLSGVLNDENMCVASYDVKESMRLRLPYVKVLLVLDDVDNAEQLEALAGDWFKPGSRVIITTRDAEVLKAHRVNRIHDVNFLSDEEALCLFSRYAFGRDIPDQAYKKLSHKVVSYAAGLPLTIKVLGSLLIGEIEDVWIDALKRLETIPLKKTLDKLEISYISLDYDHKEIFLDVACFMKGLLEEDAIRILESCGFRAIYGLRILTQKSLITISDQRLGMHDRLEELGWNIVRRSHPDEPNKHSRLWNREEIEDLLSADAGTEATTRIRLEQVDLATDTIMESLRNLKNLKVLLLFKGENDFSRSDWMFDQDKQYFSNRLQFLSWEGYPVRSLPQTFGADKLVGLELPRSKVTQLWEIEDRQSNSKVLKKLRFLDLSYSKVKTLDLRMTPELERLDLKGCRELTKLDGPTGCLKGLVYLNLIGCSRFRSFPFIKQLESLELLCLPKLEVTVESMKEFQRYSRDNLPRLQFTCSYLEEQPSTTSKAKKSVSLNLQPCTKLESVSESICCLQHLKNLTFKGRIPEVPNDLDQLTNLEELNLLSTNITYLPDTVCLLKHLKSLKLESCKLLEKLPENLGNLECLEKLILTNCNSLKHIPNSICTMKNLKFFHIPSCIRVRKLPEEFGLLKCLRELNVKGTGISHLPESISLLEGLCVYGSLSLLLSCVSSTKIQTSETETFCYIQAENDTAEPTED